MENTISEIVSLWGRILVKIKARINDNTVFDSFFSDSYINSIRNNNMIIVVNSPLAATIINAQFKKTVEDIVHESTESDFTLSCEY